MDPETLSLKVFHVAPEDGAETLLGIVEVDSEGQLDCTHAEPGQRDYLDGIVGTLNGMEAITVKITPPPDTPMFQLRGKRFTRDSPGFVDGLKAYLSQLYGLRAASDEELRVELESFDDLV